MGAEGATSGRSGAGSVKITDKTPVWGGSMQGIAGTFKNGVPAGGAVHTPAPAPYNPPVSYANPGAVVSAPAAPPRPSYSMGDSNGRIASVDSTFLEQEKGYNTALEKFISDIGRRRTALTADTELARSGLGKNRTLGLTGLGEDFAARGLGNSGLFIDAQQKGEQAYTRQGQAIENAHTNGVGDLDFTEQKEKSDTGSRIQSAKRDALYRLSLGNNIVTGL